MRKTVYSSFQNSVANHVYRIYVVIHTFGFAFIYFAFSEIRNNRPLNMFYDPAFVRLGWKLESMFSADQVQMGRIVRKPDFCLCKNKGADQLRSNRS